MKKQKRKPTAMLIPPDRIAKNILIIRNEKTILDVHLAELYDVETRTLKQAVRRNPDRFPPDLMFELTEEETGFLIDGGFISNKRALGGAYPFAFTETGVAMLSSVLKSEKAVQMNLAIMRTFVAMRKMISGHTEIYNYIKELESRYNKNFDELYASLKYLIDQQQSRARVGFQLGPYLKDSAGNDLQYPAGTG